MTEKECETCGDLYPIKYYQSHKGSRIFKNCPACREAKAIAMSKHRAQNGDVLSGYGSGHPRRVFQMAPHHRPALPGEYEVSRVWFETRLKVMTTPDGVPVVRIHADGRKGFVLE